MKSGHALLAAAAMLGGCAATPTPSSPKSATEPAAVALTCGDFLARAELKPANLAYRGCVAVPERQGKPLRATYRATGGDAAGVEAYMMRRIGLASLKRSCCQWDAPPASFSDKAGRAYSLTMTSAETAVSDRAGWAGIPVFEIAVETVTEDF